MRPARPRIFAVVVSGVTAGVGLAARDCPAAEWVDRPLTAPAGSWHFDFGLGVGHVAAADDWALGLNAEGGVGITDRIELGLRTGLRMAPPDERGIRPDEYGRLFDRQTFDTGASVLANPELRIRGALLREQVVELGLEGRLVVPFEAGTGVGMMFGVPLAFHIGKIVRLDTGAFLPIVFYAHDTTTAARFPVDVWFQVAHRLWLGPMTGLAFEGGGTAVSLGFGLGYEIARTLDLRTMFLFPDWNQAAGDFGLGVGLQVRLE